MKDVSEVVTWARLLLALSRAIKKPTARQNRAATGTRPFFHICLQFLCVAACRTNACRAAVPSLLDSVVDQKLTPHVPRVLLVQSLFLLL